MSAVLHPVISFGIDKISGLDAGGTNVSSFFPVQVQTKLYCVGQSVKAQGLPAAHTMPTGTKFFCFGVVKLSLHFVDHFAHFELQTQCSGRRFVLIFFKTSLDFTRFAVCIRIEAFHTF